MLCALILAGGKGTRFWPLSTEEKPKQFLNLIGNNSMIQMTVNRIKPIIPIERIFVCTAQKYVDMVMAQLPELPARNIIIEPEGRNTAPCITLSALVIKRYFGDANMVVLASDHLIRDEDEFRSILQASNKLIIENKKATLVLGITPSRAETGFGYIKCNEIVRTIDNYNVINVEHFVEKPSKENAEQYLSEGRYLWNAGMFLWSIDNMLNKIKMYSSDIYEKLHEIETVKEEKLQNLINDNYCKCQEISIDYAVLEKDSNIYTIPCDIGWDDVGTWNAVERYRKKDVNNNIFDKNVKVIESKSNIVINNEKKLIMIGLKDTMILETEKNIFIVNKDYVVNLKDYKEII
ncbi:MULTISPECIES: mannose-1-phosphate guanylyltransferase [unclassified Clostridium]|uniref:mannose-1-phosphate guanylyltransferase n=1 Tax=unclassified Clostridium TaxID=2614128 RepID=UPI000297A62D|nr:MULTISPECIES: mannose-1-phosphate guanylyltransferase [unclassified Clostridium]EKQ56956.1 MAG: mannose-1-phosphate guanylyltransferase [Clostridium sp. Maddingley MBC34-26]